MAKVAGNELIDVRFVDETNYPASTTDDDIVSVVVDTCWGPCERPTVCDSSTYQTLFNPQGLGWLNGTRATVERVFDMGASFVEVLRLGSQEQWRFIAGTLGVADSDGVRSLTFATQTEAYSGSPVVDDFSSVTALLGVQLAFRLRYPGGFPMEIEIKDQNKKFAGVELFTITVRAYAGSSTTSSNGAVTSTPTWRDLESLQVSFSPLEVSGQSYFYADVIASRSNYLYCDPVWAYQQVAAGTVVSLAATAVLHPVTSEDWGEGAVAPSGSYAGQYKASDYAAMYDFAKSRNESHATLYVNSCIPQSVIRNVPQAVYSVYTTESDNHEVGSLQLTNEKNGTPIIDYKTGVSILRPKMLPDNKAAVVEDGEVVMETVSSYQPMPLFAWSDISAVQAKLSSHAEGRMDCVALLGFPTQVVSAAGDGWAAGFDAASETTTRENAVNYFGKIDSNGMARFSAGIVGWELYSMSTIYGDARFDMDCTAGWAGRICVVAKSLRNRNQPPSYKAYGAFSGSLVRSLSFDSVVKLHDEDGIGSVYNSTTGNYIFDIRSLWGIGESYFARLNVMRVCAALLGQTFDIVEGVIHTDAAANRNSRLRLESRLNSLITEMIARNELRDQSYADVSDDLNTDVATHGGRYLNINLVCWFIGLVERVNISVIATDSSVRAEITQVA